MGIEKKAELSLIKEIEKLKMKAWHLDCTIDGFADILAMGDGNLSFTVEVKQGSRDLLLYKAFETSQPIWNRGLFDVGYTNNFQVLYCNGVYILYQIDKILERSIMEQHFSDIVPIMESTRAHDIALELKRRAAL